MAIAPEHLNKALQYLQSEDCQKLLQDENLDKIYFTICTGYFKHDFVPCFAVSKLLCDADINPLEYVHKIYAQMFTGDTRNELLIPNNIASIDDYAFSSMPNWTRLIIPPTVTDIGDHICAYSQHLKTVVYIGTKQQWENISKHFEIWTASKVCEIQCLDGIIDIKAEDR